MVNKPHKNDNLKFLKDGMSARHVVLSSLINSLYMDTMSMATFVRQKAYVCGRSEQHSQ